MATGKRKMTSGVIDRVVRFGIVAGGMALTVGLVAVVTWPAVNEVETGASAAYPELRPLVLRYSASLVFERTIETVESLPRWRLVEVDREAGRLRVEVETRLVGFVDDVTIAVSAYGSGALVQTSSASRVGRSDFGQNARNIERFQSALRAALQLARPAS